MSEGERDVSSGDSHPTIDFDPSTPEHAARWPEAFRDLREKHPRAWTNNQGGYWLATCYKDVLSIAQGQGVFTAAKMFNPETGRMEGGINIPSIDSPAFIPNETDGEAWKAYRQLLNPRFSPKAAEAKRQFARGVARTLVDRFIESGHCDLVEDLTSPLPGVFTMELLGLDHGMWLEIADPIHRYSYTLQTDDVAKIGAEIEEVRRKLGDALEERRRKPREDLLSYIANGEVMGRGVTELEANQMALMLVFGGLDTTTGLTACAFHYLGLHPEQRRHLIDHPDQIPVAIEEFVRFFGPIQALGRTVTQDTEMDGWSFKKGERVMIAYAAANRDPAVFDDPDTLRIDRFPNRHIGFGGGMHRCLGSFFGRLLIRAMLDEVFARLPDYRIDTDRAAPYPSVGIVNGWISIPVTFEPGPKLGGGVPIPEHTLPVHGA